jgi:hypothetical protein
MRKDYQREPVSMELAEQAQNRLEVQFQGRFRSVIAQPAAQVTQAVTAVVLTQAAKLSSAA